MQSVMYDAAGPSASSGHGAWLSRGQSAEEQGPALPGRSADSRGDHRGHARGWPSRRRRAASRSDRDLVASGPADRRGACSRRDRSRRRPRSGACPRRERRPASGGGDGRLGLGSGRALATVPRPFPGRPVLLRGPRPDRWAQLGTVIGPPTGSSHCRRSRSTAPVRATPAPARARGRDGPRRRPAGRHPAAVGARAPRGDLDLPARNRQRGNHRHCPRPTATRDPGHSRPAHHPVNRRALSRPRPAPITGSAPMPGSTLARRLAWHVLGDPRAGASVAAGPICADSRFLDAGPSASCRQEPRKRRCRRRLTLRRGHLVIRTRCPLGQVAERPRWTQARPASRPPPTAGWQILIGLA